MFVLLFNSHEMFLSSRLMGMFMGINADGWMQLWNGVIGTALSAVLAALVAVFVVWRTNKHQTSLARTALTAQREDAATALEVQRELLERQIVEQREESRRAERTQALASFIAGVRELGSINEQTDITEVGSVGRQLEAAAASLDILGDEADGLHELLHPSILTVLLLSAHRIADFRLNADSGAREHLRECMRSICSLTPKWWSPEEAHGRRFIRAEIRMTLEAAEEYLAKMKTR